MGKVLFNSVFTGGFGADERNLPHEMINFFKADDDGFYVYITPYGTIDQKDWEDLDRVVFFRSTKTHVLEVLGMAVPDKSDEKHFYAKGIGYNPKKKEQTYKGDVKEYKLTDDIKYGGASLTKIHESNLRGTENNIKVTFKAESIQLPKKPFFICTNPELNKDTLKATLGGEVYFLTKAKTKEGKINNISMKRYLNLDSAEENINLDVLRDIVDDKNWKNKDETPCFDDKTIAEVIKTNNNFFKFSRQQNNEVMFSNMLVWSFNKYPELLKRFINRISTDDKNGQISLGDSYTIEREKDRMDIRVINDRYYIIIENKIKSLINGTKLDGNNKFVREKDNRIISQLSNYYDKAKEQIDKDKSNLEIHGYVLSPNYNIIDLDAYYMGDKYTQTTYNVVYDVFATFSEELDKKGQSDFYLQDFIRAMKKHTDRVDNEFSDELMIRFAKRIEAAQKGEN